jgi:hypothetical protein
MYQALPRLPPASDLERSKDPTHSLSDTRMLEVHPSSFPARLTYRPSSPGPCAAQGGQPAATSQHASCRATTLSNPQACAEAKALGLGHDGLKDPSRGRHSCRLSSALAAAKRSGVAAGAASRGDAGGGERAGAFTRRAAGPASCCRRPGPSGGGTGLGARCLHRFCQGRHGGSVTTAEAGGGMVAGRPTH